SQLKKILFDQACSKRHCLNSQSYTSAALLLLKNINQQSTLTQEMDNWQECTEIFTMWIFLLEKGIPTEELIHLLDSIADDIIGWPPNYTYPIEDEITVYPNNSNYMISRDTPPRLSVIFNDDAADLYLGPSNQIIIFEDFISTLQRWQDEYSEINQLIESKGLVEKWEIILQRVEYHAQHYVRICWSKEEEFLQLIESIKNKLDCPNKVYLIQMAIKQICQIPDLEEVLQESEESQKDLFHSDNDMENVWGEASSEGSQKEDNFGWEEET
ncbi:hypothetical protein BDQ12DRAFT_748741, partial [Crucibulum laeve]